MKMLTVRQPWASLIADGAKTIETRPTKTTYRGPVAIHAAKEWAWKDFVTLCHTTSAVPIADALMAAGHEEPHSRRVTWEATPGVFYAKNVVAHDLPLASVVCVADLVDVVPIVDHAGCRDGGHHLCVGSCGASLHSPLHEPWPDGETERDAADQLPFGDFTPGRYAWMLDNVRRIAPVPAKGFQGLRDIDPAVGAQVQAALQVST